MLVLTPHRTSNRGSSAADITLVKALAPGAPLAANDGGGPPRYDRRAGGAEKVSASHVSRLLRLTLLAPNIVGAIVSVLPQLPCGPLS